MRCSRIWTLPAVAAALALGAPAGAQVYPGGGNANPLPKDARSNFKLTIKRGSASGMVKSLDPDHKTLVLETAKGKEMPIDVGPAEIKAGRGKAKFADIRTGDKISVYGEVTVVGGLRAMEISVPKERMSIIPPTKAEKKKADEEAKKLEREAREAEKEAKKADDQKKKVEEQQKKAEEQQKKAEEQAKKAEARAKKSAKSPKNDGDTGSEKKGTDEKPDDKASESGR